MDTTAAAAMADTSHLSNFDGHKVVRTSVVVSNAGDGLSDALGIDPQEFSIGETGYLLIEWECVKVTHKPISKDVGDLYDRGHTLKAGTATIVGADLAEAHIAEQAARNEAAKRRAKGEFTLDDEAMIVEHDDGQHAAELRTGCPKCDDEKAAAASEQAAADAPAPDAEPTSLADARAAKAGAKKATGSTAKKAAGATKKAPPAQ